MAFEQSDDFDFDLRLNGMREAMMKQRNLGPAFQNPGRNERPVARHIQH